MKKSQIALIILSILFIINDIIEISFATVKFYYIILLGVIFIPFFAMICFTNSKLRFIAALGFCVVRVLYNGYYGVILLTVIEPAANNILSILTAFGEVMLDVCSNVLLFIAILYAMLEKNNKTISLVAVIVTSVFLIVEIMSFIRTYSILNEIKLAVTIFTSFISNVLLTIIVAVFLLDVNAKQKEALEKVEMDKAL